MCEIVQNETAASPIKVGSKVRLNEKGKALAHERLKDLTGVVSGGSLSRFVAVQWQAVHVNSGSNERLAKNGPHVPRVRAAMTVLPVEWLEAAE